MFRNTSVDVISLCSTVSFAKNHDVIWEFWPIRRGMHIFILSRGLILNIYLATGDSEPSEEPPPRTPTLKAHSGVFILPPPPPPPVLVLPWSGRREFLQYSSNIHISTGWIWIMHNKQREKEFNDAFAAAAGRPRQTKSDAPRLRRGDGGADLNKYLTSSFLLLKVCSRHTGSERERDGWLLRSGYWSPLTSNVMILCQQRNDPTGWILSRLTGDF